MSWFKHFYERGRHYGYPRCCVRSFVYPIKEDDYLTLFENRPKVQQLAAKNGFIPCLKHSKMILDGEIKIEDLILPTRMDSRPFGKRK